MRFIAKQFVLLFCIAGFYMSVHAQKTGASTQNTDKPVGAEAELRLSRTADVGMLTFKYYDQYYHGMPIVHARMINVYKGDNTDVAKTYDYTQPFNAVSSTSFGRSAEIIEAMYPEAKVELKRMWQNQEGTLHPVQQVYIEYDSTSLSGIYDVESNSFLRLEPNESSLRDSSVTIKVFNPDPLTSAHQVYGSPLLDYNDSSYAALVQEAQWLTLQATYDAASDSFLNETEYVKLKDIDPYTNNTNYKLSDTVEVSRSESKFEDMMILYHIDQMQNWIQELGVQDLSDFQVLADSWAEFGNDNSLFSTFNPPRLSELTFGTGGVDDAEDADVITHEYGHALLYRATGIPVSSFSQYAKGLQEGIADFIAACYSHRIDPYGWERLYSWDGHNPYWDGRITNSQTDWPIPGSNIYAVGEIFNSALFRVARTRDLDSTMTLLLSSLFLFDVNSTPSSFAEVILDMDTLMYNSALSHDLCMAFYDRKLVLKCSTDAVKNIPSQPFVLQNEQSFAHSLMPLRVHFEARQSKLQVQLTNTVGQVLREFDLENEKSIEVDPISEPGFYFLYIKNNQNDWTIPLQVLY